MAEVELSQPEAAALYLVLSGAAVNAGEAALLADSVLPKVLAVASGTDAETS